MVHMAEETQPSSSTEPASSPTPHADAPKRTAPGAGVGSLLVGTALVAVGLPMLVLPGPGIAAIAGGGVLIARGLRARKR